MSLSGKFTKNVPKSLISIYSLQKRAIRIVSKSKRLTHHIPLCHNCGLLDLFDLYKIKALSFFHDYWSDILPPVFSNLLTFYVKNDQLFIKNKYCRTEIAASTIMHALPSIWNPLDNTIKQAIIKSKTRFIKICKQNYISSYASWTCELIDCYICSKY